MSFSILGRGQLAVLSALICAPLLWSNAATAVTGGPASNPSQLQKELALLRQSTAPFHLIDKAIEAQWDTDLTGCLDSPIGGMGHHYANINELMDGGALDVARPEALVYHPEKNGRFRLVAAEYIVLEEHLDRTAEPPVLFGQAFSFNPHAELWALHVWVWHHNPAGMFADWNPRLSCEFAQ